MKYKYILKWSLLYQKKYMILEPLCVFECLWLITCIDLYFYVSFECFTLTLSITVCFVSCVSLCLCVSLSVLSFNSFSVVDSVTECYRVIMSVCLCVSVCVFVCESVCMNMAVLRPSLWYTFTITVPLMQDYLGPAHAPIIESSVYLLQGARTQTIDQRS